MAIVYCTRHKIGFNTAFEAVCPQCSLARLEPAPTESAAVFLRAEKEQELARVQAEVAALPPVA